jgi:hypothetical protein
MTTICSIDPGIKNLGICIAERDVSGNILNILLWENFNLVSDSSAQLSTRCSVQSCKGPASWSYKGTSSEAALLCKKCGKKGFRGFTAVDPEKLKTVSSIREFATELGWADAKKKTKAFLVEEVAKFYLMPYKAAKAKSMSPADVFGKIRVFVETRIPVLKKVSIVRIENQKSIAPLLRDIQMQIYSLMRYILEKEGWTGTFEFVHPGSKNKGDEISAGSDKYKERKDATLGRIEKKLSAWSTGNQAVAAPWILLFNGVSKKYDLADTLQMCLG